LLHNIHDHQD